MQREQNVWQQDVTIGELKKSLQTWHRSDCSTGIRLARGVPSQSVGSETSKASSFVMGPVIRASILDRACRTVRGPVSRTYWRGCLGGPNRKITMSIRILGVEFCEIARNSAWEERLSLGPLLGRRDLKARKETASPHPCKGRVHACSQP